MKMKLLQNNKIFTFFNWEYWPSFMFYIPNIPYALFLAFKAKNFVFFSAANPGIKSSGNGTESKFETLQLIPDEFKPKSIFHGKFETFEKTLENLAKKNIKFPVIAKPDVGFRGLLVKKIHSEIELKNYLQKFDIDFIIQEFIDYKDECGIFYSRNPSQQKGVISSITLKKFPKVIGDGVSTIEKLIVSDKRLNLYRDLMVENNKKNLNLILNDKEEFLLSNIGNHCKGTQFVNGNHQISKQLTETFDNICSKIPGWFYGRIDLKYDDFSSLEKGKNFTFLEINGIISEPTHIYDTQNSSYFAALKSVRKHWEILYNISVTNHKMYKIPYMNWKIFWKEIKELKVYSKKIATLSELKT